MGLELDEILFKRIANFLKKKRTQKQSAEPHRVFLQDINPRLTLLARALAGAPITLYDAEREGGWKGNAFFLPNSIGLLPSLEENVRFYFFRIMYMTVQREMGLNLFAEETSSFEANARGIEASDRILQELFLQYPAAEKLHADLKQNLLAKADGKAPAELFWIYGKFMYQNEQEVAHDLQQINDALQQKRTQKEPETTIKAGAVEDIKSLAIDKKQQEDYVLLHNFEKVETAEEFSGSWRDFDGSDQLEEHQNALEELNMKFTVRVDDPTHSVYQAEFVENTTVRESATVGEQGFYLSYDEWDFKKRLYKTDYCRVYPKTQIKTDAAYYHKTIANNKTTLNGLRKMLSNVNNKMLQHRRQPVGEELDYDAVTDLFVDVHTKKTPSENIYLSKRKKEKDLSVLLLLDLSLSSDGYAANSRVIDVEKEVSILFGEILNEFTIDFCIDGFYSKTRNFSTYITLKEFEENWHSARYKIGAAHPSGYTRIGASLRHAGARIAKRPTQNKWIIVLSDGKPNDYDRYEGQYGIQDVKQALRELNQNNIHTYALAIEAQARYYLPQMFGQNHYQILTHPTELLKSLMLLYERIKHAS